MFVRKPKNVPGTWVRIILHSEPNVVARALLCTSNNPAPHRAGESQTYRKESVGFAQGCDRFSEFIFSRRTLEGCQVTYPN